MILTDQYSMKNSIFKQIDGGREVEEVDEDGKNEKIPNNWIDDDGVDDLKTVGAEMECWKLWNSYWNWTSSMALLGKRARKTWITWTTE